jgi:hypothetical protein
MATVPQILQELRDLFAVQAGRHRLDEVVHVQPHSDDVGTSPLGLRDLARQGLPHGGTGYPQIHQ